MSALLRQSSVDSMGIQAAAQRSSINFNLATPAIPAEKGFRTVSKLHSGGNDNGSNASALKEDFTNRLEFRIRNKDLEVLKQAIDSLEVDKNEQYKFSKEEFVNFLTIHLDKGTEQEYEELFDNIDVTQSGFVDWDKFTSYLLIMMYESDDRIKAFSIPNWKPIKQISNNHSDSIKRCEYLKNLNRYMTISKEGTVCLYDRNLNMTNSTRVNTDSCKSKDLWITDFAILGNVNKLALAFTTKEIGIYELNTKLDFNCQYKIYNLKATPLCLDYWYDAANPNDSILVWGDTAGECHTIHFNSTLIALFERPNTNIVSNKSQNQSANDSCLNIAITEIKTNYKNAVLISYPAHNGWVRQVKWIRSLECVMSCATTNRKSVCMGWFNKKGSHIRVNYSVPIRVFEKSTHLNVINGGVNGFDFDSKMNLLATANQNTLVNLFNPYVLEPNGILKGHSRAVLAVKFMPSRAQLISFSEDRILRIWNVALQICIQRIANIFPKGPDVETMCAYDEFAARFFISFRFTLFMMEIKPEVVDRVMTHTTTVVAARFNKHNQQIVTLSQDGTLYIWLIENGQKIKSFNDLHSGAELTAFEFDEQGVRFYTGASDGLVKVWDFNGHCYHTLEAGEGAGSNCEISQILAIKRRVLAMGWKRTLAVFRDSLMKDERVRAAEWNCVREEHQDDILCAAIMKTQPMFLLTGGFDGDIVVWNSVTEQPYKHLSARKRVTSVGANATTGKKEMLNSAKNQSRKPSSRRMSKMSDHNAGGDILDPENDFSKAVICLRVLNTRTYGKDCTLVSCGGNGWVRFWEIASGRVAAEFVAHQNVGSVMMEREEESEKYLATGDINGLVKIWDIADYCLNFDPKSPILTTEPPLVSTIKCHTDQINSIDFCNKNGKLYVLVASSDCSVSLSDVKGTPIGIFGQEIHWKLDPMVQTTASRATGMASKFYSSFTPHSEVAGGRKATLLPAIESTNPIETGEIDESNLDADPKASTASLLDGELNNDEELRKQIEDEVKRNCHLPKLKKQLSVVDTFQFEDDAFVNNVDLRYNPWSKTILGKVYQETRTQKRERKQPGIVQSEEYQKWDRTGQAPGGLYGSLQIVDIESTGNDRRLESIKKKLSMYDSQSTPLKPISEANIKHANDVFDEKSLFPKYILDYEARMKQEHKAILARLGKPGDQASPANFGDSTPSSRLGYKKRSSMISNSLRF